MTAEVIYKWTDLPLNFDEYGWYRGTVSAKATATQKVRYPGVNYEVQYFNKDTSNVLPARDGVRGRRGAKYPLKQAVGGGTAW